MNLPLQFAPFTDALVRARRIVDGVLGPKMSTYAVRARRCNSSYARQSDASHHVCASCDGLQVVRVHAMADATQMIEFKAGRDFSVVESVREAMGINFSSGAICQRPYSESSVAVWHDESLPQPTVAGRVYQVVESYFCGDRNLHVPQCNTGELIAAGTLR